MSFPETSPFSNASQANTVAGGFEGQQPLQPTPPNRHPLANYQFSSDELRVLRECNTESFFQRSLPLGTILGVSTYYGVRQGFLTPNAKYGAAPKVVLSVIIGYFLGKFSYQQKCAEKMMALPNSRLGQLLRQRKQGPFYNQLPQPGFGLTPFGTDMYSDEELKESVKGNSLDLDTERPTQKELDDIYKPSLDDPAMTFEDTPLQPSKPSTSYDDLRRKNREEYLKSRNMPVEQPVIPPNYPPVIRPRETPEQKNKYGDSWS